MQNPRHSCNYVASPRLCLVPHLRRITAGFQSAYGRTSQYRREPDSGGFSFVDDVLNNNAFDRAHFLGRGGDDNEQQTACIRIDDEFCRILMTSVLIGEVAVLLAKSRAATTEYDLKMEEVNGQMTFLKLPHTLQERVRGFYEFMWTKHRSTGGEPAPFVNELSPSLRSEVQLFLKRKLIVTAAIFKHAPISFIRELVNDLILACFLAGDYVIREGEYGTEMFFISRGSCMVTINGQRCALLNPGTCFGEIAVIRSSKRTASVHAYTHTTLYILDKSSVDTLREEHPGCLEKSISKSKQHQQMLFAADESTTKAIPKRLGAGMVVKDFTKEAVKNSTNDNVAPVIDASSEEYGTIDSDDEVPMQSPHSPPTTRVLRSSTLPQRRRRGSVFL